MRKTVYLCLTTVVLAATALAQSISTTQAQQDEKVVVGTNLVTLNVIVTDSKGRYVKGLSRDQFDVYDNKVKQQIAHFLEHLMHSFTRLASPIQRWTNSPPTAAGSLKTSRDKVAGDRSCSTPMPLLEKQFWQKCLV